MQDRLEQMPLQISLHFELAEAMQLSAEPCDGSGETLEHGGRVGGGAALDCGPSTDPFF